MQRLSLTIQHFLHSFYPSANRVSSPSRITVKSSRDRLHVFEFRLCHLNYLHLRDFIYERIVKLLPLWLLKIKWVPRVTCQKFLVPSKCSLNVSQTTMYDIQWPQVGKHLLMLTWVKVCRKSYTPLLKLLLSHYTRSGSH